MRARAVDDPLRRDLSDGLGARDPLPADELDELVVRASVRPGTDTRSFETKLREELLIGVEITPNRVEFKTTPEMLEVLGMETEMKEKRCLDRRPK